MARPSARPDIPHAAARHLNRNISSCTVIWGLQAPTQEQEALVTGLAAGIALGHSTLDCGAFLVVIPCGDQYEWQWMVRCVVLLGKVKRVRHRLPTAL